MELRLRPGSIFLAPLKNHQHQPMIILIAESKTMSADQRPVNDTQYAAHTLGGELQAEEIMWNLRQYTEQQIMDMLGCSAALARQCRRMIYDFPDKLCGCPAIEAYTGVVFRHLGLSGWNEGMRSFADKHLRIVSSLYGLLRPSDIIKPYRLDYSAKAAPGNIPLQTFWRPKCTVDLASLLSPTPGAAILNLLPGEAMKCLDRKLIKHYGRLITPLFKEYGPGGVLRTPAAGKLKEMRGKLVKEIVTRGISDAAGLLRITDHPDFQPVSSPDARDGFIWLCQK